MNANRVNLWMAMLLAAMAGGMGWGIRGQYGHQTGAMIAGLLVGLVLVMLFARNLCALSGARAVAFTTLGIAIGGSMTYGQTVGLTHDGPLIGNWAALRWGMLGLFVKGAIWIGLAGLLLGMSLAGIGYTMIILPWFAVLAGRYWPYVVVFPLVLIPIAGKTLRHLCYNTEQFSLVAGWTWFVLLPIPLFMALVPFFARQAHRSSARIFACRALPIVAWMYFGLKHAFFEFPWPWLTWTGRTPNGLIFSISVLSLTAAAWYYGRREVTQWVGVGPT